MSVSAWTTPLIWKREKVQIESKAITELFAKSTDHWPESAGYDGTVGCLDVRRLPEVTKELVDIGFDQTEIVGILGANFRRVAERVWK